MKTEKRAKTIKCRRSTDCRCWQPEVIDPLVRCPRPLSTCACRYTWRDTHWEKGDDHAQCPVHVSRVTSIESPEE